MSTEVQTGVAGPDSTLLGTGQAQSKNLTDRRLKSRAASKKERERSIPSWEWDAVKADFLQLYSESKVPLMQCMTVMKVNYNFVASRRQYLAKIREWNVDKNIKAPEMRAAARKVLERWVLEGKDTSIEVRGKVISKDSLKRFLRRELHNAGKDPLQDEPEFGTFAFQNIPLRDKSDFGTFNFANIPLNNNPSPQSGLPPPTASPATISRYSRWALVEENLGIKLDHSKTTTWLKGSPLYRANVYSPAPNAKGLYSPSVVSLFTQESKSRVKASESKKNANSKAPNPSEERLRRPADGIKGLSRKPDAVIKGMVRNPELPKSLKDELVICVAEAPPPSVIIPMIFHLLDDWVSSWIRSHRERGDYLPVVSKCDSVLIFAALNFSFQLFEYLSNQQVGGHIAVEIKSSRERERYRYFPRVFYCPTCSSEIIFRNHGLGMFSTESEFFPKLEIRIPEDLESGIREAMIQLADNIQVLGGDKYEENVVSLENVALSYPPRPIKNRPFDSSSRNKDDHSSFAGNAFIKTDDISIEQSIDWLSQYIDFDVDDIPNTDPDPSKIFLQDDTDMTIRYGSWPPKLDDLGEVWLAKELATSTESNKIGQSHFSKDFSMDIDELIDHDLAKLFEFENMDGISIPKSFDHWQSIREASSKPSTNLEGLNTSMVLNPSTAFPSNDTLFSIQEETNEAYW
ncbi:hypothetical protein H072_6027 [Dactylellina haptotyla CBS 200.50]|uniref:Clr5 domain-containing protein n=1 Tax=Dactylellina haptotyla (strain CBS 200.50) TaxID=1284197 RepID=S8BL95_DACHA|nr:hypothetical protein H072_6027 [Dactylellina haptotyla CBS 200.50]